MNNEVDFEAYTESQASLFDTRDQEQRKNRSGDIGSKDVALACELHILFKKGQKTVRTKASAHIVSSLGDNRYVALTARTNLFSNTKDFGQIKAESGLVYVQRKSKKEFLAKFKFDAEGIFHYGEN